MLRSHIGGILFMLLITEIAIRILMFLSLMFLDKCIIYSFSLSLCPCTINRALCCSISVPGCLIDYKNLLPNILVLYGSFLSTYSKAPLTTDFIFYNIFTFLGFSSFAWRYLVFLLEINCIWSLCMTNDWMLCISLFK